MGGIYFQTQPGSWQPWCTWSSNPLSAGTWQPPRSTGEATRPHFFATAVAAMGTAVPASHAPGVLAKEPRAQAQHTQISVHGSRLGPDLLPGVGLCRHLHRPPHPPPLSPGLIVGTSIPLPAMAGEPDFTAERSAGCRGWEAEWAQLEWPAAPERGMGEGSRLAAAILL